MNISKTVVVDHLTLSVQTFCIVLQKEKKKKAENFLR